MTIPAIFDALLGEWTGTNRVWVSPTDAPSESATTASIATVGQGKFAVLRYTWAYEGAAQDGLLLLGIDSADELQATWIDSWHMQDVQMHCVGAVEESGAVAVAGTYAAPPGPDWGWQIRIDAPQNDGFRLQMFNIWPTGERDLGVEAQYVRPN